MSPDSPSHELASDASRLEVQLDAFSQEALRSECERMNVTPQELVEFAIAYYLADLDSGRIARRVLRRPGDPAGDPSGRRA